MNNECLDPTLDHHAEAADILHRMVETVRPALVPTDGEWSDLLGEIGDTHAEYCSSVSPANMAASIETCAWLLHLCRRLGARRVLDLGSGISSWLLRHHAATADYPVEVVSVDDDAAWLAKTVDFLAERFATVDGLMTLPDFGAVTHDPFDVVFHDIAGGDLRSEMMATAAELVGPDGVVVFDDCQHDGHRHHAATAAEAAGMSFVSLHSRTLDKFSRFAMAGLRSGVAEMYAEACRTPSDIYLHLPRMVQLVHQLDAQHVLELGSRSGVSTIAWLHALQRTGGRLTSVDLDSAPAIGAHDNWTHVQGDDTDPELVAALDPADIVFIDTSHLYDHTVQELAIYRWLVRPGGVICLHDTELPTPEGAPPRPLYPVKKAVTEFIAETGWQWHNYPDCWGFAVIRVPEE